MKSIVPPPVLSREAPFYYVKSFRGWRPRLQRVLIRAIRVIRGLIPICYIGGNGKARPRSVPACSSVTQFRFPLRGGRQGILLSLDRTLARLLHPSGLSRVEFNVGLKLGRDIRLGVDGVHRTFIHAGHAIDALLRVNDQLTLQLVKAGHGAHDHAIGEFAPHTFIGNDMRHKSVLFQFPGLGEQAR